MLLKRIPEFGRLPWGYRWAYLEYHTLTAVAAPFGIHLLARWVRRLWEWSLLYKKSDLEELLGDAYDLGWRRGRDIQRKQDAAMLEQTMTRSFTERVR